MPSLLEALEQKYGMGDSFEGVLDFPMLCDEEPKSPRKNKQLNVAIFIPRRSPRMIVPTLLVLNNCEIETSGCIQDKCQNVQELDLAGNALTDWKETLKILNSMPELRFVNLSFNELAGTFSNCDSKWVKLQSLVLNSTKTPWDSVQNLVEACPNLQELHLSFNGYKDVNLKTRHQGIKKFHFAGNKIESWKEVTSIGQTFPELQSLVLANCPIAGPPNGSEEYFPNLISINLDGTNLETWQELENLSNFERLQTVRVRSNFGEEHTEHERRMFCIARLPKVTTLNGGPVEPREREDAERAFIRHYSEVAESDRPGCYVQLVAIHGQLDPLVNIDLTPEKKVTIKFIYGSEQQDRVVDVKKTVSDLKGTLESFCGIPPNKMRLFYLDQDLKGIQGPEEMKYPAKQLYSYNIRNGDEILIDEKRSCQRTISLSSSPSVKEKVL